MKPLNNIFHVPQSAVPHDTPQQVPPQAQAAQPVFNPSGQKYQTHTGAGRFSKYMQANGKSAQGAQYPTGPQAGTNPDMADMRFAPALHNAHHARGTTGSTASTYTHPNAGFTKSNWHPGMGMPDSRVHQHPGVARGWDNRTNNRPYNPIVLKKYPSLRNPKPLRPASKPSFRFPSPPRRIFIR